MFNFLLDLIFPKKCVSCRESGKFICDQCIGKIEYFLDQVCPYCERPSPYGLTHPRCSRTFGLDGMFVLAHYRGPIRQAIREIKYHGTYGIVGEVVRLLGSKYHNKYDFESLVPVPLHPNRERERGFNQAETLAKRVNEQLAMSNVQYIGQVLNLLKRIRETKPQFGLKGKARQENVRDAFAIIENFKFQISNSSVCLVDDVSTTGSTIFECAKVLKRAGAKKVWAICIARGG